MKLPQHWDLLEEGSISVFLTCMASHFQTTRDLSYTRAEKLSYS